MRVVALGNPEGARIGYVQQALARLGRPPAEVVPWLAFLRDPARLGEALAGEPSLLRIESCGQDWSVERELIAQGAEAELGAAEPLSADAARALEEDRGRIRHVRQRHAGFLQALQAIQGLLDEHPATRVMNPPASIALSFDKRACHQACASAGVPVPPALGEVRDYAELREGMRAAGLRRVFVKLATASSASGVVALATQGAKVAAHTTVELVREGAASRFYNSLEVRRYADEADVATIVDALCREGVQVEAWIPKASLGERSCDLRQVVIAGRAAHAVVRTSATPLTNLHLANPRGELSALRALIGDARFAEVQRACEAAHRAVGAPLYSGVDVCVARRTHDPYVLEVNAFGDLLPRVEVDGRDTYAAELLAAFAD